MIQVVAGIISKKGKYLVAQRPLNKNHGGKWEFPGGKVESNETNEEGLIREFLEELSLHIEVKELVYEETYYKANGSIQISFYRAVMISDEISPSEHIDYKFLEKEKLRALDLCPADKNVLGFL